MAPTIKTQGGQTLMVPWAEYVSRSGSTLGMSLGWTGDSQATMTIDVLWEDFENGKAIQGILGYAYQDKATLKLRRYLPMRHPVLNNMAAVRIQSVQGVMWTGKASGKAYGPHSQYWAARLTVVFQSTTFVMLDDAKIDSDYAGSEFYRFVDKRRTPRVEAINREQGSFKWVEGGGSGPVVNDPIPFGCSQTLVKVQWTWRWLFVPEAYLFDSSGGTPKIDAGLGCVNSAAFGGYPAGTLLLLDAPTEPVPSPIPLPEYPLWYPQRLFNVNFAISYFKPDKGGSAEGHNLLPWIDGKWYLVKDFNSGARTLYKEYDFAKLFQAATAP